MWWRGDKATGPTEHFSVALPFSALDIKVAPNGHTVALVGFSETDRTNVLWIYEVGEQQARE